MIKYYWMITPKPRDGLLRYTITEAKYLLDSDGALFQYFQKTPERAWKWFCTNKDNSANREDYLAVEYEYDGEHVRTTGKAEAL